MSQKLLFIFNPHSGKGQIKNNLVEIIDTMVKADFLEFYLARYTLSVYLHKVAESESRLFTNTRIHYYFSARINHVIIRRNVYEPRLTELANYLKFLLQLFVRHWVFSLSAPASCARPCATTTSPSVCPPPYYFRANATCRTH